MKTTNPWIKLIVKFVKQIKAEGKLKGRDIVKEAIRRAKKVYKKK